MNKRQKIFATGAIMLVLTSLVIATYSSVLQKKTEIGKLKIVATFYI